jgi:DNA-directed RNA polymerase specialized sigma24 family protein
MSDVRANRSRATPGLGATVLRGLTEDELLELLNKLRLFAARRYYGQLNVDDLAMQGITDTLAGKRSWDVNYTPLQNLCWIVRSIASNQLQKEGGLPVYDLSAADNSSPSLLNTHLSPAEIYEADETQRNLGERIRRAIGGDNLLGRMVAFVLEQQTWKPKELAAKLNISEPAVYNAKRRIQRRLGTLLDKS